MKQVAQFDVVVVGGGGAGLAAGLEASRRGANVMLLEKSEFLGGTTGISVGSFTAAGTLLQKAARIEDKPEWHNEDMRTFAGDRETMNDWERRDWFAQRAGETLDWLRDLGLEFHGPTPEPPNRVPRMHNVVPNAKIYVAVLHRELLRHGVSVQVQSRVQRLLRNDTGTVVGVEYDKPDGTLHRLEASSGVVLATGDYTNGGLIKNEFLPREVASIEGINPYATGDGHRMAREVGATLVNMNLIYGPELRFVAPPRPPFAQLLPGNPVLARLLALGLRWVPKFVFQRMIKGLLVTWQHPERTLFDHGAILVNVHGNRFCNETDQPELSIPLQERKIGYILLDQTLAHRFSAWPYYISTAPDIAYAYLPDYQRLRPDLCTKAKSLADLARRIKIPSESLVQTVRAYNDAVAGGRGDSFGRKTLGCRLSAAPFHALGPVKSMIVNADGGLCVNTRMEVLDPSGNAIPGLYAAGSVGIGGLVLWGHGLHIAWAFTSGREAGRRAALRRREP